jgi:hypothetical protein
MRIGLLIAALAQLSMTYDILEFNHEEPEEAA